MIGWIPFVLILGLALACLSVRIVVLLGDDAGARMGETITDGHEHVVRQIPPGSVGADREGRGRP